MRIARIANRVTLTRWASWRMGMNRTVNDARKHRLDNDSPNRNLYDVYYHVGFGGGWDDGGEETVNKMRKPKNLDNYNECLDISDDPPGVCVFCIECDEWHSVDMIAMGRARIGKGDLKDFEPEDSSIKFECSRCGADVNYIVLCDWRRAIKAMLEWI